jgi:hypothetical protein
MMKSVGSRGCADENEETIFVPVLKLKMTSTASVVGAIRLRASCVIIMATSKA